MAPVDLAIHTGQPSPRQRRSHSISSDRPSITGYGGLLSPPSIVSPDPAFIAASAASQIVTNDHDSQADAWFDQHGIEPSGETALVSPPALKLVNRFLDQLLFNFLSISRSTSLASLRPAVAEVLKPKLAKDAINGADQELQEYLGGGEEEELLAFHNGLEPSGDWDIELVWKRTRLRCMVYSSLGDMEEEDEDYYTEQEQLDGPPGSTNRFSNNPGVVSPAVAIFLTSILEFMGEQVLVVAGQAAYHKLRIKHEKEERDGTSTPADIAERVVVEDSDMEKVALDRTLGRLWRGWKKRIRSPTTSVSLGRTFSHESLHSLPHAGGAANMSQEEAVEETARRPSLAAVLAEHEHAASIALPMNKNDIREIEIPGLALQSDDEEDGIETEDEGIILPPRPKSMIIHHAPYGLLTPNASQPQTPTFLSAKGRKRSNSLPSPAPSLYTSPKRAKPTIESSSEETAHETIPTEEEVKDSGMANDDTAPASTEDESKEAETQAQPSHGVIAEVVAGVSAIGAAAVAGIVAVAQGKAPQTELVADEIDPEEEFAEEPQILTSSRVSLPPAGRVSPEDNDPKEPSRRSSIRSTSVHSLRLIDVGTSRSPGMSRASSVDAGDYVGGRPAIVSRPNSTHSAALVDMHMSPRGGSPQRGPTASPIARNGSSVSSRHPRNSAGDSIDEVEERESDSDSPGDVSPATAVPADLATAMQGVDIDTTPTPTSTSTTSSPQYASEPLGRENTKKPAFVLSAPPASRHYRDTSNNSLTDQALHSTTMTKPLHPAPSTSSYSRVIGAENGIPPLTPLREMMEGAQDTSDDNSSIATSSVGQTYSSYNAHSLATIPGEDIYEDEEYVPNLRPRNYVRGHKDPWKAKEQAEIEKAAKDKAERARAQQSKAIENSPPRQLHTSGSGSSSTSSRLKVRRTSEDSTQKEVKGQSFEQLIRSDTTIQYTLTPQNMRDIESPVSPRFAAPPANSVEARPTTGRSHSSSISKHTHSTSVTEGPRSVKSPFKPVSRPPSNAGSRQRQNAPQPREARVNRDSMGDFAEFIRSTGPTNAYGAIPESTVAPTVAPTPARSASVSVAHRGMNGTRRNMSGSVMTTGSATSLPRRSESSAGRVRLQAREAAVARGDSISDLIDFVRSGPQLDRNNHRIPRTVAPFRTTMDSDQMSGAVGGKAIDASLSDARYSQTTVSVDPSAEGSISSQSALIKNNTNKPLPAQNNYNTFEEEDRMPKRKTRRVRDPYAIDLSDDDEEDFAAASRPKPVQEESLADFLRSVPPPPEPVTVTSVFDSVPRPASSKSKTIKKKSSSPSLMARFSRSNSSSNIAQQKSVEAPPPMPKVPAYTPIAAKYSTTYGKNPINDVTSNGDDNYLNKVDNARGKVIQKRYQPREASYREAPRTSDLADFLMQSPPPSDLSVQPQTFAPTVQKEERGSFQRMFGRGKKNN